MKIGNSIKVKAGIACPDDESYDISGWQGRILSIDEDLFEIEWDSITLSQMPEEFIINSVDEDLDYTTMWLELEEIDISLPRDKKEDVAKKQEEIDAKY